MYTPTIRALSVAVVVTLSVVTFWPTQAAVQDSTYVYCRVQHGGVSYFSGVYTIPFGALGIPERNAFGEFINENFVPGNLIILRPLCESYSDREGAESSLRSAIREANRETVQGREQSASTNWTPDGTNAGSFDSMPIQDVHIMVSRLSRAVRVCVRDHECEDGDQVRVSVNGSLVLQGEISTEWSCEAVRVNEGRNSIELYASNGTGHKGNCSHADVNTGELRVAALDADTQTWRHRGGAGSRANIVITVR